MELALISMTHDLELDLLRRPSNPPLAEDWSRFKNIILKMYDEEDRPLSEVRSFMETCHGFYARSVFPRWAETCVLTSLE